MALAVSVVQAQQRVGALEGVVLDQAGTALPGATITISGENMMGERAAVSDDKGAFRFVLVPPGSYHLEASLDQFQTVREEQVRVELGGVTRVEITMAQVAFAETVSVVADQVVIDTSSNKVGGNLLDEFVDKLANDRQYQSVMQILPGVIEDPVALNPRVHGASGSDNMYLVDGADATDALEQKSAVSMNFDNFQEVQVITGGAPAEYGRSTGAVVNLITKSGSNDFHGIFRYTYADEDLNSELRGERFAFNDLTRYVTENRPSANLGGPILRDRLWFFASYEKRDKTKPTTFYSSPTDAVAGVYTAGETSYKGHYATAKLTAQFGPKHTISAFYIEDPVETPFIYAYRGDTSRAPESDNTLVEGGVNYAADWTGVLSDNIFLHAQYAINSKDFNYEPYDTTGTTNYTGAGGGLYWNAAYREYFTIKDLETIAGTYNHFLTTGTSTHELKVGIEYAEFDVGRYNENYINDEETYVRYKNDGVTPDYKYVYIQRSGLIRTDKDIITLFAQDVWRVTPDLTLNVGVRVERFQDKTNQGEAVLDWGWGDRIQPRLGFAYNINGNRLHGFVGRYHDNVGSAYPRVFSSYPDQIRDRYNWSASKNDWVFYRRYITGAALATRDDLKSPYMDEAILGYEARLSGSLSWGVSGIYREWRDGLENEDGRDVPGNPAADGNNHYTNVDKIGEYKGIELSLRKVLAGDKLQFHASYTYSQSEGIWGGDDDEISEDYGSTPYAYYNQWGRLSQDRPHVLKFNGSYLLPYDFRAGASLNYWSGMPYTTFATVKTSAGGEWGGVSFGGYHVSTKGANRLPDAWRLDLRLEKDFSLGPIILGFVVDVFNATDNQEATDIDANLGTITLEDDEPGAAYTVIDANSRYGQYIEWQAPRSYFFGFKVEF
jgi:hypothetical protein